MKSRRALCLLHSPFRIHFDAISYRTGAAKSNTQCRDWSIRSSSSHVAQPVSEASILALKERLTGLLSALHAPGAHTSTDELTKSWRDLKACCDEVASAVAAAGSVNAIGAPSGYTPPADHVTSLNYRLHAAFLALYDRIWTSARQLYGRVLEDEEKGNYMVGGAGDGASSFFPVSSTEHLHAASLQSIAREASLAGLSFGCPPDATSHARLVKVTGLRGVAAAHRCLNLHALSGSALPQASVLAFLRACVRHGSAGDAFPALLFMEASGWELRNPEHAALGRCAGLTLKRQLALLEGAGAGQRPAPADASAGPSSGLPAAQAGRIAGTIRLQALILGSLAHVRLRRQVNVLKQRAQGVNSKAQVLRELTEALQGVSDEPRQSGESDLDGSPLPTARAAQEAILRAAIARAVQDVARSAEEGDGGEDDADGQDVNFHNVEEVDEDVELGEGEVGDEVPNEASREALATALRSISRDDDLDSEALRREDGAGTEDEDEQLLKAAAEAAAASPPPSTSQAAYAQYQQRFKTAATQLVQGACTGDVQDNAIDDSLTALQELEAGFPARSAPGGIGGGLIMDGTQRTSGIGSARTAMPSWPGGSLDDNSVVTSSSSSQSPIAVTSMPAYSQAVAGLASTRADVLSAFGAYLLGLDAGHGGAGSTKVAMPLDPRLGLAASLPRPVRESLLADVRDRLAVGLRGAVWSMADLQGVPMKGTEESKEVAQDAGGKSSLPENASVLHGAVRRQLVAALLGACLSEQPLPTVLVKRVL